MQFRRLMWFGVGVVIVAGIVLVMPAITPQENPAFATATVFMNAAENGDDETTAFLLLSAELQHYVQTQCPNGRVSDCIQAYSPPEWGKLLSAVFRRAAPDGANWDVDVIATYEQGTGVSGVCSTFHVEQNAAGKWRIYRWAGFIWCGDPASRNMAGNPDAPNRAP